MEIRVWFSTASQALLALLPGLKQHLDQPALGDWTVRSLLGHTSRAYTTMETYLGEGARHPGSVVLESAAAYYRAAAGTLADPAQVTERGHQAGATLGPDPCTAVADVVERVLALVQITPDTAPVATPLGTMSLAKYLTTRAFEVSMHSLDLARATHQTPPQELLATMPAALRLACQIAAPEQQLQLLLAATGRQPLSTQFNVL